MKGKIMKRITFIFSLFVLFVSVACGLTTNIGFQTIQGSGKIVSESRDVSGFTDVEVCCGMELYLTQGDVESLEIEADDNFMEEIITTVVGNRLEVKYERMNNVNYNPSQPVKIYLTMVDVLGVSLSGGGYLEADTLESEGFDLSLSGGSDAWIADLVTGNMDVSVSGGGELNAQSIQGDQTRMDFSGGSDAQIENLTTTSTDISNSGGGNIDIDSCETEKLKLTLSGGSDGVINSLDAETLEISSSGGGTVEVAGSVTGQTISMSGGSRYLAEDLKSDTTSFSGSGGGRSTAWVLETLLVNLSGGSVLEYYGSPSITNSSSSSSSELVPLGER